MKRLFISALMICMASQLDAFQKRSNKDYLITITTNYGEMKAILFEDTPLHRDNFLKLVDEGFYDSLLFHRVINEFMIQGGDPESKHAASDARLGRGGPGYRIDAEINSNHFHQKGALAAARTGDNSNPERRSSGSQFYIVQGKKFNAEELKVEDKRQIGNFSNWARNKANGLYGQMQTAYDSGGNQAVDQMITNHIEAMKTLAKNSFAFPETRAQLYEELGGTPFLDGQYTVFGQVISGLNIIDSIAQVKTNRADRPLENVWMKIRAERIKKKKITKMYGYEYQ